MNSLGAFIVVRDGNRLDYSWREAAESLLHHVQELVICDSDSTDGTTQEIQRWAEREPKIRYANFHWTNPKGVGHRFFVDWLNYARQQLTTTHYLYLDADEVLSDHIDCVIALNEAIADGRPRRMHRLNFWKDAEHLIPHGKCCGFEVVRFGPTNYEAVSDEPHEVEPPIVREAIYDERLVIFHVGFLRERSAFFRKARAVLNIWTGGMDERLVRVETENKPMWEAENEWGDQLVSWHGYISQPVQRWLAARGHWTQDFVPMIEESTEQKPKVRALIPVPASDQPTGNGIVAGSSGDGGDLVNMLSILANWPGGPHTILLREDGAGFGDCRTRGMLGCEHVFSRLALSQPYIKTVRRAEPHDQVNWASEQFRVRYARGQNLIAALAATDGVPNRKFGERPWLSVTPMHGFSDRIIVNRTNRWRGQHFPWRTVADFYREKILLVGTDEEHKDFCRDNGDVEYYPTQDFLEVAQLIAGSALFIGNQSACMAIAIGLGAPFTQEVCLSQPDCIYKRDNGQYCYDGSLTLTNFETGEKKFIASHRPSAIPTHTSPPGGWQYLEPPLTQPLVERTLIDLLMKCQYNNIGLRDDPALLEKVKAYNGSRPECAQFFFGLQNSKTYGKVYEAMRQAGYQT